MMCPQVGRFNIIKRRSYIGTKLGIVEFLVTPTGSLKTGCHPGDWGEIRTRRRIFPNVVSLQPQNELTYVVDTCFCFRDLSRIL